MSLRRISSLNCISTKSVLSRSYSFDVRRIHTITNAAQMIRLQSLWNWSMNIFVRKSVRVEPFIIPLKLTVPLIGFASKP